MPHIILEYTDSAADSFVAREFFGKVHHTLAEFESFSLGDIKSRAYRIDAYQACIGDGDIGHAFAALRLGVMSGRDVSVRQRVAQALMRHLEEAFQKSVALSQRQLSVEIYEMDRSTYYKNSGNTTLLP